MIAFLDAEFNCGISDPEKVHDSSLIEVALIVVPDMQSNKIQAEYHAFCRPKFNQGKIYPIIRGMTHIRQKDVDHGKDYKEIFADIKNLIETYKITKIYVWGNFDRHGFIWNCKQNPEIEDGSIFCDLITDITKDCTERIGIKTNMGLKDMAYICDCMAANHHNAIDDTKMLFDVIYCVYNNKFDQQKVFEYTRYMQHRDAYNALKKAINRVKQTDANLEEFLKMADRNQGFPHFIYQKDKM